MSIILCSSYLLFNCSTFQFSLVVYMALKITYYLTDPLVIMLLPSTPLIQLSNDHLPYDLQSSLLQHVS